MTDALTGIAAEFGGKDFVKVFFANLCQTGPKRLSRDEFLTLFRLVAPDMSEQQTELVFAQVDTENEGSLDFERFIDWVFCEEQGVPMAEFLQGDGQLYKELCRI